MRLMEPIPCKICGKTFKRMGAHVKAHNMTLEQYRSQHGATSNIEIIVDKINDLFITRRDKWGHAYHRKDSGSYGYRTNNAEKHKVSRTPFFDRNLTDKDIVRHLKGGSLAVIHTPKGSSKFLCFDLDAKTDVGRDQSQAIASQLIEILSRYFPPEAIHLEFSGGKGFHIWIFFDRMISIEDLLAFACHVTQFNQGNADLNIEFRPESAEGKGVKLPLGIHNKTGNFCSFLNKETFAAIEDQYGYLLQINRDKWINYKAPKGNSATQAARSSRPPAALPKTTMVKIEDCGSDHLAHVWQYGLPGQGMRNRYTLFLAIWLKDRGLSQPEVVDQLMEFTDREHQAGRTKDSAKQSRKDIESTVLNVFEKNLLLRDVGLTEFDNAVIALQGEKLQESMKAISQLARIGHREGYFYLSREYVGQVIGKTARSVSRHLLKLEGRHLFRTHTGIPAARLAEERRELIGSIVDEQANFFFNPESGENSLYFLPTLQPIYYESFTRLPKGRKDQMLLETYCWARRALDYMLWRSQHEKHRIIENKGKPFPVEDEAEMEGWAEGRKREFFPNDALVYASLIKRIEDHFCGGVEYQWSLLQGDPVLQKVLSERDVFQLCYLD